MDPDQLLALHSELPNQRCRVGRGTVIHGSLCRVVTFTPPAEPSASAADSRSSLSVIRCFKPVMNSLGVPRLADRGVVHGTGRLEVAR
ncbi:hypothetical protein, partial [Streptomyces sp900116325]|uniref:hypothetical protein n=1 Tax=Streptomyces sp. 900116325 TaxID=3154295 RepID=UPI0033F8F1F9